jgi:hypothetical protein
MYITLSHLKTYKPEKKKTLKDRFSDFLLSIFYPNGSEIYEFDDVGISIFLSHKHDETNILELVSSLFKNLVRGGEPTVLHSN